MAEHWVTINGERGAYWQRLLGRRRFRVAGPLLTACKLPGYPGGALCYHLDLGDLSSNEVTRLAIGLADRFGTPVPTPETLAAEGVPILAAGTTLEWNSAEEPGC
jgi:hypothetical protein